MRRKLEALEKLGKFKIKIVERAGIKLVDMLHKSNAWEMQDCNREDCIICGDEKGKKGMCRKRNVLYETYCITCGEIEIEKENETDPNISQRDGTNDTNDTPVFVEVEVKSNSSNMNKENSKEIPSVVQIPIGNSSSSESRESNNYTEKNLQKIPCPDIYKKGTCSPPTELPTVISHQIEKDGEIVVQIPIGNVSSSDNIETITRDGTSDTNDTPVYVEVYQL